MRILATIVCSFLLAMPVAFSQVISNDTVPDCSGTLYDTGGAAGQYGAFEAFQYSICPTDPHACIAINVLSYDTEPIFDNLTIYDGPDNTAPVVATLNGTSTSAETYLVNTTGCVTIGFTSDGGVFGDGFELTWSCSPTACPDGPSIMPPDLTTCIDTFYDSGGISGSYLNDENWIFSVCPTAPNTCIIIDVNAMDIAQDGDVLTIYNGTTSTGIVLGQYFGPVAGDQLVTDSGCFSIAFSSTAAGTAGGWDISWECTTTPCPIPPPDFATCSGTFYDSGGPAGDYANGENMMTTICPDPDSTNQCIFLNFTSFEVESGFDNLDIYNGPTITSPLIGQYTGSTSPGLVFSTDSCLTVVFTSDGSVTDPGWVADIFCAECGSIPPCIGTTPACTVLPDACPDACDLGILTAPTPCPFSTPASQTFCIDNIGATAENPYSSQAGCDDGNNMPDPAADVWYSFTASSNQLTFDLQTELNAASIGVYEGTCAGLQPLGCNNSTNGNVNLFVAGISPGVTYYIQISGEDVNDQGDINMTIESSNNCDFCMLAANLVATPPANAGTYQPNQTVTFCFTVTEWNQAAANWFHSVVPDFGSGWDITTLNPTVIPPSCDGNGVWLWQQTITGTNGSSANPGTVGPGFVYDSASGGPLDGNGENNFGDNCSGPVNWEFCWEITTSDCPPGTNGESLSVEVETYGDSETGSWEAQVVKGI